MSKGKESNGEKDRSWVDKNVRERRGRERRDTTANYTRGIQIDLSNNWVCTWHGERERGRHSIGGRPYSLRPYKQKQLDKRGTYRQTKRERERAERERE